MIAKGTLAISDLLTSFYVEGSLFRKTGFPKLMVLCQSGKSTINYKLLVGNALWISQEDKVTFWQCQQKNPKKICN